MIEYRTGMQNGVQIVHIFIEAAVRIRHVVLLHSFRFGTKIELEKRKSISRPPPEKIFERGLTAERLAPAGARNAGFTKKSRPLLKPKKPLLIFCLPRPAARAPPAGPG